MGRNDEKKQRGTTGLGYLYKRDSTGNKLPATSKAAGVFWLRARGADGKTTDRRLLDDDGEPIRDLKAAKARQRIVRAAFLTGSRLAEVQAQIAEHERLLARHDEELELSEPPMPIKGAWAEYLRHPNRRQCGDGTLENYRLQWGQFTRWLDGKRKCRYLRDITPDVAEKYAACLIQRGVSANTYNKAITFLRSFFALLWKQARMTANPFSDIQRRRHVTQSRRTLTLDELREIITKAEGEMRTLLEIGIYTGLRLGDCCTLMWKEIHLESGIIRRIPNKTAKTSGAVVEIGIPNALFEILSGLPRAGEYVLPGMATRYQHRKQSVSKAVMRHLKSCGMEVHEEGGNRILPIVRVSFYSLRHSWVSLQTERGTPMAIVQKAAGHSNPVMTEHYTHIGKDGLRQMANAVDFDFSAKEQEESKSDKIKALLERFRRANGKKQDTELEELAINILLDRLDKNGVGDDAGE